MDRKRNRLEGYDYSWSGYYFVTICIKDRKTVLGKMNEGKLELTERGLLVEQTAKQTPSHYAGLEIDEMTIMPNHMHVIYIIGTPEERWETRIVGTAHPRCPNTGDAQCASPTKNGYGLISKAIQAFKSIIKRKAGIEWQRSFWDHVIRNEESYLKIKEYIINNPLAWELDAENPDSSRKDLNKYYEEITGYIPPERKEL